jgi:hypothetical protein
MPRFAPRSTHHDPLRPHPFAPVHDPGIGAFAIGGGPGGQWGIDSIVTTSRFLRASVCGVPGCGRPRSDRIHQADPGADPQESDVRGDEPA